jgi:5-methylcytosine-specific restriction protein A
MSKRIERNAALRAKALEVHGLDCMACGLNFHKTYGKWGEGFAEVHHLKPLHLASGAKVTTDPTSDLLVLCSNCHRMVHRKANLALTLEELQEKLRP